MTGKLTHPPLEWLRSRYSLNEETGEILSRRFKKPVGHLDKDGYLVIRFRYQDTFCKVLAHRLVFSMFNDVELRDIDTVDHIDRNRTNNAPHNLRHATRAEQRQNVSIHYTNKVGVKGVYWCPLWKKYRAYIGGKSNGGQIKLGAFNTIEEATEARSIAEVELGYTS